MLALTSQLDNQKWLQKEITFEVKLKKKRPPQQAGIPNKNLKIFSCSSQN